MYKVTIVFPTHSMDYENVDEEDVCNLNKNFRKKAVYIFPAKNRTYTIDFSKVLFISFDPIKQGEK